MVLWGSVAQPCICWLLNAQKRYKLRDFLLKSSVELQKACSVELKEKTIRKVTVQLTNNLFSYISYCSKTPKMIKDTDSSQGSEDEYVRLDSDAMTREPGPDIDPVTERDDDEEEEPPLFSTIFAVDQLKSGAEQAAAFFSWGLGAVKSKASELTESEGVKQLIESTKPQREAIATNASQLWESTKPQREELARTASTISEQVQPTISKIKTESAKAIETIATTIFEDESRQRGDEQMTSGTATDE